MRRILLILLISFDILAVLYVYHSVSLTDKNFRLIFCNVGQGDGILLRLPGGKDVIIDGGPEENGMTKCLSRHLPFWDRTIDAVFLTHPDSDHLTGLIGVVKSYNVRYFGTAKAPKETDVYKELMTLLEKKNIKMVWNFRGDKVGFGNFVMTTHWPTQQFLSNPSEDTNDYSLVQAIKFGQFSALLTGDVPFVYLNSIMPTVGEIDVFKSPHHGSKTGVDEFTFQHVRPELAILSYGKTNRYGHPNKEVLSLFKNTGVPYMSTTERDIVILSDGKKWWVKD